MLTGLPADGGPMLTGSGDGLVLADSFIAAVYLVVASHLAPGSDPVGLTATQFPRHADDHGCGSTCGGDGSGTPSAERHVARRYGHCGDQPGRSRVVLLAVHLGTTTSACQRQRHSSPSPLAGVAFAALVGHEPLTGNVLGSVALICLGLTVVARPGPKGAHRAERAMTGFTITSGTSADLPARNAPNNSDRADGDKAISGSPSVRLGRCTPKIPPTAPGVTQPSRWTSNPTATGDPSPPQRARWCGLRRNGAASEIRHSPTDLYERCVRRGRASSSGSRTSAHHVAESSSCSHSSTPRAPAATARIVLWESRNTTPLGRSRGGWGPIPRRGRCPPGVLAFLITAGQDGDSPQMI